MRSFSYVFAMVIIMATGSVNLAIALDAQSRNADITGKPPRIAPLPQSELKAGAATSMDKVRERISLPPLEKIPDYTAIMLKHPTLYEARMVLGTALYQGTLSPRDRELAVLRIAWLCQAPFAWGDHVKIGKREGGLTGEDVERMTIGSSAPGWDEGDRAIVKAVEELHAGAMISDATWSVLSRHLDEKQLIELPILVGQYQGGAYLQNSLRVPLMLGNRGLAEH